jgi:hypothetical protein
MRLTLEQRYSNMRDFESNFPRFLKLRYGPGFYVAEEQAVDNQSRKVKVGISVPEFVDDAKTKRRVVRFRNHEPVFIADVSTKVGGVRVTVPTLDRAFQEYRNIFLTSRFKTEGALLKTMHERLIGIPLVSTALSPIREIIRHLHRDQRVRVSELKGGRGEAKALLYLTFLEGLDFVQRADSATTFLPGPAYYKHETDFRRPEKLYNGILAQVLQEGFQYLAQYMKLSQLVPFVRASNSYFLPARFTGRLLHMAEESFKDKFKAYYGRPHRIDRLLDYVDQIRDVRVFDPRERDFIVGEKTVFKDYMRTPLAIP